MNVFDFKCPNCETQFAIAESDHLPGQSRVLECSVCGDVLASFDDEKLRVSRVLLPAEQACFHVPADAPQPLALSLH